MSVFKPAGVPARGLDWVVLPLDCFEAVRLVDYEGLDHEQAAERLGVSRPTVTRILQRARSTIARALISGSALAIEGGPVIERPMGAVPPMRGRYGRGWRGGGRGRGRRFRGGGPW